MASAASKLATPDFSATIGMDIVLKNQCTAVIGGAQASIAYCQERNAAALQLYQR